MTDRIDEISARCDQATPGPWEDRHSIPNPVIIYSNHMYDDQIACTFGCDDYGAARYHQALSDAAFIANAREDIPYLLGEIERLGANCMIQERIIKEGTNPFDKDTIVRLMMEKAGLTARAEKAEADRDTYKAALQNWHEEDAR